MASFKGNIKSCWDTTTGAVVTAGPLSQGDDRGMIISYGTDRSRYLLKSNFLLLPKFTVVHRIDCVSMHSLVRYLSH